MKKVIPLLIWVFVLGTSAWAGIRTDIEFARVDNVSLRLDAYVPEGGGPFPAVIVVHGGGFTRGDKQAYVKPLFEPLTRANFAWFTINYRLAPKFRYPAAVEDVERAVRYVKTHAKEYKVDPKRLALVGESAGGYLVSLVGARNKPGSQVAAVVAFYAPHDLVTYTVARISDAGSGPPEEIKASFGFTEMNDEALRVLRQASPITYVKKGMPPFLLIHGTRDRIVPYQESVKMCERMKQSGVACELFTVEGAGHGIGGWEKTPAYKEKMVKWLKTILESGR